jgi:hypothetical protein
MDGPRVEQDAELRHGGGGIGIVLAVDPHRPARRPVQPGDHPHRGGLPRPVRAEESGDHARLHHETQPVDGSLLPVPLGQAINLDHFWSFLDMRDLLTSGFALPSVVPNRHNARSPSARGIWPKAALSRRAYAARHRPASSSASARTSRVCRSGGPNGRASRAQRRRSCWPIPPSQPGVMADGLPCACACAYGK